MKREELLVHELSGSRADRYAAEILVPQLSRSMGCEASVEAVQRALQLPWNSLAALYGHYAFARRGKDRARLEKSSLEALYRTRSEVGDAFFEQSNARAIWNAFEALCKERSEKPMEQLNLGPIAGLAETAQEIFRETGGQSLAAWIVESAEEEGRIEDCFTRMVELRGVGPKIVSLFLRDLSYLFDLESLIEPVDRLYLLPMDKWLRQLAPVIIDEPEVDDMADWVMAGKITKHVRRMDSSPVRVSMGATYFGLRELRFNETFETGIQRLSEQAKAQVSLS
jgi:hypothetical protein